MRALFRPLPLEEVGQYLSGCFSIVSSSNLYFIKPFMFWSRFVVGLTVSSKPRRFHRLRV